MSHDNSSRPWLVTVYVNNSCYCGPTLVPSKVKSELPSKFGPVHVKKGLHQILQALLSVSKDQQVIFNLLESGTGRVVIQGAYEWFVIVVDLYVAISIALEALNNNNFNNL